MASEHNLIVRIGRLEVDWPRTLGYFGGAAAAVAFGVVEVPLGLVIAAAPLAKMLDHPGAPSPMRLVGQIFEGAVKPVGGDDDGTFKLAPKGSTGGGSRRPRTATRSSSRARSASAQTTSTRKATGRRTQPTRRTTA